MISLAETNGCSAFLWIFLRARKFTPARMGLGFRVWGIKTCEDIQGFETCTDIPGFENLCGSEGVGKLCENQRIRNLYREDGLGQ